MGHKSYFLFKISVKKLFVYFFHLNSFVVWFGLRSPFSHKNVEWNYDVIRQGYATLELFGTKTRFIFQIYIYIALHWSSLWQGRKNCLFYTLHKIYMAMFISQIDDDDTLKEFHFKSLAIIDHRIWRSF